MPTASRECVGSRECDALDVVYGDVDLDQVFVDPADSVDPLDFPIEFPGTGPFEGFAAVEPNDFDVDPKPVIGFGDDGDADVDIG